jgi:predicted RNA-binding protein YlxR (DUF448 family)
MAAQATSDEALTGAEDAETDAGPPRAGKAGARQPERRCIATMERRPQKEMIRFVLSPDGSVVPDIAARLPGRGGWVTATREAIDLAVKRGAFARAFKAQVKASADLASQVESLLARRAIDMLGMAKRSGDLTLGFEQVREAVRDSRPACLVASSDASEDQRNKVLGLVRAIYGPDLDRPEEKRALPPVVACFSGDELGMALGRERVVHACLKQGRIAHAWMGELARLSGFRHVWLPGWQPVSASSAAAGGQDIEDFQARDSGGNSPADTGVTNSTANEVSE